MGCYCVNSEQPDGICNEDYRIKFLCCQECPYGQISYWTPWFNRDTPGGDGDYETLADLLKEGKAVCPQPFDVQCLTKSGAKPTESINVGPKLGCSCINSEQTDLRCVDYKVRFKCCK